MLEIEVVEVRGRLPVHKVGDRIVIDGTSVVLNKTDALYVHAFSHITLCCRVGGGADPLKLGLTKPEEREHAYVQCVDPWKPYTEGGAVIFRIRKVR